MGKTILTTNQQQLLESTATDQVICAKFYLTGGTALSEFYLQHRLSEDLDFFSEQEVDVNLIQNWARAIAEKLKAEVTFQSLQGQLIYYFHFPDEVVKVDFAYFPFPVLGEYLKYKGLRITSIEDIAVNKLQALLTRTRGRDYVDLFSIIQHKQFKIDELIKDYRLKFDVFVTSEQWAKSFVGVLEASDQPKYILDNWQEVKQFFIEEAKKLQPDIIS